MIDLDVDGIVLNVEDLVCRWQRLKTLLDSKNIRLIAVSKYTSDAALKTLADAGQQDFGESRPQQLRDRAEKFPTLQWHIIGPVQKNKAKYIGRFASMWHSLDDEATALAVAKHVQDRILPVLIQVNVSGEEQKSGVSPKSLVALFRAVQKIESLEVIGLMGMAAKEGDTRSSFALLRQLRDQLLRDEGLDASFGALCMGMSGDFETAIEEGTTMVRIGSTLFSPNP